MMRERPGAMGVAYVTVHVVLRGEEHRRWISISQFEGAAALMCLGTYVSGTEMEWCMYSGATNVVSRCTWKGTGGMGTRQRGATIFSTQDDPISLTSHTAMDKRHPVP